jgi:hypothetical protein
MKGQFAEDGAVVAARSLSPAGEGLYARIRHFQLPVRRFSRRIRQHNALLGLAAPPPRRHGSRK